MATIEKKKSGTTDLTVGRLLFRILCFALPLVLGTLFQQLYSFVDTVIVGWCLGTDALGAVFTIATTLMAGPLLQLSGISPLPCR